MHRAALTLLLTASLVAPVRAGESEKLQEITRKWQSVRGGVLPLEVYLRNIVAEDPHFRGEPDLNLERLDPDIRQAYEGLHYLLSETLQAQFLGLSSDSLRAEWLRRYWKLRDPTPTTPENERRAEHERRVDKARREFGWRESPGWDERGAVLILCGEPDSMIVEGADVQEGMGYVPAHADWLYLDEKWVAEFERPSPRGPWVLGRATGPVSQRPDEIRDDKRRLGYDSEDLLYAGGRDRAGDLIGLQDERTLLAQKGLDEHLSPDIVEHEVRTDLRARELLRQRELAIWSFAKAFESGQERFVRPGKPPRPLWYVFDVDVFAGRSPGRMRVEVHYQFNLQDLKFRWQDSLYVAKYTMEGVLLDRDVHEVLRDSWSETLTAGKFRSTVEARLQPGQLVFEVPEGSYRLAVRLYDRQDDAQSSYASDIEVPRLDGHELALSDIELATKMIYADESWHARFVKKDRLVIPNPIGIYRKGHQITGYFEVYGLQQDAAGVCHYKVTYTILPRSATTGSVAVPTSTTSKPFVTASFTGEGGSSELVEELRIDAQELDEDAYDLVLTLRDLLTDKEATARTAFAFLK